MINYLRMYVCMYATEIGCLFRAYILYDYCYARGHAMSQLVVPLRYKPEGRGFDP